jgi:hypothetical protein
MDEWMTVGTHIIMELGRVVDGCMTVRNYLERSRAVGGWMHAYWDLPGAG